MKYTVRKAQKTDMSRVLTLIEELAEYEKELAAVEVTVADLERDGFGSSPLFTCYVVEAEGVIRGMALFYFRYSTWKGKTVHLEDLVVEKAYRGKGLGMALYRKVMEYAQEQGVKRIEWAVLDWNEPAIRFYKKTGATVMRDWDTVHFDNQAYHAFLNSAKH